MLCCTHIYFLLLNYEYLERLLVRVFAEIDMKGYGNSPYILCMQIIFFLI